MIAQKNQIGKPHLAGFVQDIISFAKQITIKDGVQFFSPLNYPKIKQNVIEGHKIIIESDIFASLQLSNKLFLFTFKAKQNFTSIKILEFIKEDGKYRQIVLQGIIEEVISAKAVCMKETQQQRKEFLSKAKRQGIPIDEDENRFHVYLLIGTKHGYLKILKFSRQFQKGYQLNNLKLDVLPIQAIEVLDFQKFFQTKLCLVLSHSNHVYLVNFKNIVLISVYHPTMVACDISLGLAFHHSGRHFIQYTEGGYMIFWTISQYANALIKKSNLTNRKPKRHSIEKKFCNSIDLQLKQNLQNNKKGQKMNTKDKEWNLFPFYLLHSASIQGLKWVEFFGDLVALITTKGVFKIVAPNFGILTKNQFCLVLKHEIEDGQAISDVIFSPLDEQIIIVRSSLYHHQKQIASGPHTMLKSTDGSFKQNYNIHYKPQIYKNYNSKNMSRLEGKKHLIERIKFNNQLQIEYLQKIRSKPYIDSIQGIFLSNDKSIIILRGKKELIVAKNKMFKSTLVINKSKQMHN